MRDARITTARATHFHPVKNFLATGVAPAA